ncbi:hypothetical protein BOW53_08895 [Solemya pervernicosa gill symbiont]|uniref:Aromatic hydrocarbon degradation protein n=2 Tax=Solemya pervernicosa gill symbiont TaxID=642797 RepID=A0A1T2L504_9GAMM|nr:hypothetical protein BOW53_08895 [Solemya pervernicosa gill symbiont]
MAANATNGMNLEGYGPIATGMGGASMAYDNGTAAVMNNPATLGLMEDGDGRFDAALGMLGPDVTATGASAADSDGTMYWMPALGYAVREGNLTYGIGVFSQGGMGTDYDTDTWPAMGEAQEVRSEVGVGRLILPVAFNVNDQLTLAGSADLVWAGMDLRMSMPCSSLGGMVTGATDAFTAFACDAPNGFPGGGTDIAQLDFSDDSRFTGAAKGYGLAGKLGIHYQANDVLAVGATFHSRTYMSDLDAGVNFWGNGGILMTGDITVKNFQWPSTFALGVSVTPSDKVQLAMDVKRIRWSETMKNFEMTFSNAGGSMDFAMPMNWEDQTVVSLGGSFAVSDAVTLRAGYNKGTNPVPNSTLNYLFPATPENHVTLGLGYVLEDDSEINVSYARALMQTDTSGSGVKIDHAQNNFQFMYSAKF